MHFAERTLGDGTIHQIERIPGCLSREQGALLCYLADQSPETGCIVEIGSFMGRSTLWLAGSVKRSRRHKLYSIDPHEGHERPDIETGVDSYKAFLANIRDAGVADLVTVLRAKSQAVAGAWSEPIGLLWIDGSHAYEDVLADLEGFARHVVPGGFVTLHDTRGHRFPGVRRAMFEYFARHAEFTPIARLRNMSIHQRTGGGAIS